MKIKERNLAYAFFNSCIIKFKYKDEDEIITLYSVDELTWDEHDSTRISGCTSPTGLYKTFYTEGMSDVNIYKKVHQLDL